MWSLSLSFAAGLCVSSSGDDPASGTIPRVRTSVTGTGRNCVPVLIQTSTPDAGTQNLSIAPGTPAIGGIKNTPYTLASGPQIYLGPVFGFQFGR